LCISHPLVNCLYSTTKIQQFEPVVYVIRLGSAPVATVSLQVAPNPQHNALAVVLFDLVHTVSGCEVCLVCVGSVMLYG